MMCLVTGRASSTLRITLHRLVSLCLLVSAGNGKIDHYCNSARERKGSLVKQPAEIIGKGKVTAPDLYDSDTIDAGMMAMPSSFSMARPASWTARSAIQR
jgi:hypothetical protein